MKNEKGLYLISAIIFTLLAVGYVVDIAVDFYYGYTPRYLNMLHILAVLVSLTAAIVNWKRYANR